jgi:hypothetical protein
MIQGNNRAPNAEGDEQAPPHRRPSWTAVFSPDSRATIEERAQHRDTKRDNRGQEGLHEHSCGHMSG